MRLRIGPEADPFGAFRKDEEALVRHLDDLVHGRACAYLVQVCALRRILPGIPLRDHEDGLVFAQGLN